MSDIERWREYLGYWEGMVRTFKHHQTLAQDVASRQRAHTEMVRAQNACRVAELQLTQLVSQKLGV